MAGFNTMSEEIKSIAYSTLSCWTGEEYLIKLINNYVKIVCEYSVNGELKKTLEIEQEIWQNLTDKLFLIIKQKNYFWNNHYFISGDFVTDTGSMKIEIKNESEENIEIKCMNKPPEIFKEFLLIMYDIYYERIKDKNV